MAIACEYGLNITEVRAEFIELKGPGHGIDEQVEANPKRGIILGFLDAVAAQVAGSGGKEFNDQEGRSGRKGVACTEAQTRGIACDIRFSASAFGDGDFMFGAEEEGFSGCGPGAEGEEQPGGNACVEVGRGFFLREEASTSSPGSSSSIWADCSRGIETGACSGLRVEGVHGGRHEGMGSTVG